MEGEGYVIPELQNQPELYSDAIPYLDAFRALSSSRQTGFGVGYISYSEICSFLNENKIYQEDDRNDYIRLIKFIDHLYVSNANKK